MANESDQVWGMETLALCVKDCDARVVSQNRGCEKICGDVQGKICEKGCMTLAHRAQDHTIPIGMQSFPAQSLNEQTVDIVLINDGRSLITLMLPIDLDIEHQIARIASYGLSEREAEIASLVLRGKTNREISHHLQIALSTVKKHLYSIYQKIPEHEITTRRSKVASIRRNEES